MTVCTRCGAIGGYHKGWCPEQPAAPLPMTAPAEDPRGGEALYPLGRGCCGAPNAGVCHQLGLCWMKGVHPDSPGYRAALPAGDRAQPTEELRELRADMIAMLPGVYPWGDVVDRLLAGPLAALLDAQAKVERVEAVMARCNAARAKAAAVHDPTTALAYDDAGEWIRRALGGKA